VTASRRTRGASGTERDLETDSGNISSDSLCTPPEIYEPLYEFWGGIPDCDPATNEHALIRAHVMHTSLGLVLPWRAPRRPTRRTWVNWPYSTNEPWAAKAVQEMKTGNVAELVIFCMTVTSPFWWRRLMLEPRRNPRVICTRRIKFLGPGGKPLGSGARFDTSLIYYGPKPARFDRYFRHVERWSTWGR